MSTKDIFSAFGKAVYLHRLSEDSFCKLGNLVDKIPVLAEDGKETELKDLFTDILAQLKVLQGIYLSEYVIEIEDALTTICKELN